MLFCLLNALSLLWEKIRVHTTTFLDPYACLCELRHWSGMHPASFRELLALSELAVAIGHIAQPPTSETRQPAQMPMHT